MVNDRPVQRVAPRTYLAPRQRPRALGRAHSRAARRYRVVGRPRAPPLWWCSVEGEYVRPCLVSALPAAIETRSGRRVGSLLEAGLILGEDSTAVGRHDQDVFDARADAMAETGRLEGDHHAGLEPDR